MERMLERSDGSGAGVGIDQRRTAADGGDEQRPPTILTPSKAREQHDRQGEEAQDEAGVQVGPDQEDDRKPPARLRASEVASRTSTQPRSAYSCGRTSRN